MYRLILTDRCTSRITPAYNIYMTNAEFLADLEAVLDYCDPAQITGMEIEPYDDLHEGETTWALIVCAEGETFSLFEATTRTSCESMRDHLITLGAKEQ